MYLPGDPARAEVLAEMVQPLAWSSRHRDLQSLCRRALDGEGRPQDEIMFRMGLGLSLMGQGRFSQARPAFEQMMASSAMGEGERVTGEAYAALCGVYLGDLAAAERVATANIGPVGPRGGRHRALGGRNGRTERREAGPGVGYVRRPGGRRSPRPVEPPGGARRGSARPRRGGESQGRAAGVGPIFFPAQHSRQTAIYHYVLVGVEYAAGEFDAALAEHQAGLALAEGSDDR